MFKINHSATYWPVRILALLILSILLLASSYSSSWASKADLRAAALETGAPLTSHARDGLLTAQEKEPALSCNYCISPTDKSFTHEGGNGTIAVTAPATCSWIASTTDSFITLTSGTSGTGNGTLNYTLTANSGSTRRVGTIAIAGRNFSIFQGVQFNDIPANHPFYTEIGKLSGRAITLGCGGGNYCPEQGVSREQMAAFIMRALGELSPATPATQRFADVAPSNPFYNFIERLAQLGITLGCGTNAQGQAIYCPQQTVTREQMAAFLIRALGEVNPPVPAQQRFADVGPGNPFYHFIDRLAELGITLGCGTNGQGQAIFCPGETVTRQQMAAFIIRAFDQPKNGRPTVNAGSDQAITLPSMAMLNGTASDDGLPACGLTYLWSQVSGPGVVNFSDPASQSTTASFSAPGTYVLRLMASDFQSTSTDDVTIVVNPVNPANQPPAVNAGSDQTLTLPSTATLNGSVSDDGVPSGSALAVSWTKVSGPGTVIFGSASAAVSTAMLSEAGSYVLRLTGSDSELTSLDEVLITVNADPTPPPPDPATVAPPVNPGVATTLGAATEFLYSGVNPIQTGVTAGTINPVRAAVLRGRVLTRGGAALPKVKITILNHPEFGQTFSRADGWFDLAVNGGGWLTVNYEKPGFIPVHRQENVSWQDYSYLPEAVMVGYDNQVTPIALNSNPDMQVAQGSAVTDSDGTRRATLLVPPATSASMVLPDGSTQALTNIHVRATEFTVGANGQQAMPGVLPPTSGYTYALEYSVDEAVAVGASTVQFSQPVIHYLENFLNFPVGLIVPTGYYDRNRTAWNPVNNGRVIRVVSISSGLAELDTDGDGVADNNSALGITTAERERLGGLYQAGQSLWRVPLTHFTPVDCNMPVGPPAGAQPPNQPPPQPEQPKDDPDCQDGSIIECQNQVLGETVEITGTPLTLNYRSNRAPVFGRGAAYVLKIPVSGTSLPASLRRIEVEIEIAGRIFRQQLPAIANQTYTFTWDGIDGYGRLLQGAQQVNVRIGYIYEAFYLSPAEFERSFARISESGIVLNRDTLEFIHWQQSQIIIGQWNALNYGVGGWMLSAHHYYDPIARVLYRGDGARQSAVGQAARQISTVAGSGQAAFSGDGGPATAAGIDRPSGVAVGPDGSIYIADTFHSRVRRVSPSGIITTFAGNGSGFFSGDGGPATQAGGIPYGMAVAPDGSLYIVDANRRIRRVGLDGIINTVAGTGMPGFSGDGGPATQANIGDLGAIAVASDGSFYFSGNNRIRKVGADGIIETVAGNGTQGFSGDGGPATQAALNSPTGVALGADGSLYIGDRNNGRIRRVRGNGIIETVAANVAADAIAVAQDGTIYSTASHIVQRVSPDGLVTPFAGGGLLAFGGDGGPATAALLNSVRDVALGQDGNLYIADRSNNRIRQVQTFLPSFNLNEFAVASENGRELFVFDSSGRHLRTVNVLTGATIYTFNYDSAGRLLTLTDGDGNVTTIERHANGAPTAIIAPLGQRSTLSLDGNAYLMSITNPAAEGYQFSYTGDGLLTTFRDPKGNISTMTYDAQGRLIRDEAPQASGNFSALTRTETANSFTVSLTSALSRTTSYLAERLVSNEERRVSTLPNGLQNQQTIGTDGTVTSTFPDGMRETAVLGPDPRWRMQAPLKASQNVRTPANRIYTRTHTRAVTLTNPNDPLSLATQTDAININGRTHTGVYTAASRTFTTSTPVGRQTTTTIDTQGRITQRQFANLNAATYTYDARGRLFTSTSGTASQARLFEFGYNSDGYLSSITDPLNRLQSFLYDTAGRVTQQTLPGNRQISYSYDANRNLTSITPPGRPTHTFAYTAVNLVSSYTPPDVGAGTNQTLFAYNADRQLTLITRPDGLTLNYDYDGAGRLSILTIPGGQYISTYNATTGNLASITAPGSSLSYSFDGSLLTGTTWTGTISGNVSRTYDNNFRITSQSVNSGNTVNFTYDNDSLLTSAGSLTLTRNAQNGLLTGTTLSNLTDTWGYNDFAELMSYSAAFSGTGIYSVQHDTRDNLGRVTQKTETIGGLTDTYNYTYDLLTGWLTGVQKNSVPIATYTYDSNGNRQSYTGAGSPVTGTYDNQDRLMQYGATTYAYTPNGELLSKTAGGQNTAYQYDVLGNLKAVTLPDNTQIEYLIDGQNRRIGKRVNGTLVQGFLYLGQLKPIAELDGSNNVVSRFIYGSRSNVPDYLIRGGVTYRIISDHLGSPRLVVNVATGAIAQRLDYDEFGVVLMDTNPGFQPFGLAGGIYDTHTKLVRFGARDYDPETGRWTAKDPAGLSGGINLYLYVKGDPLNFIDPTGKAPKKPGNSGGKGEKPKPPNNPSAPQEEGGYCRDGDRQETPGRAFGGEYEDTPTVPNASFPDFSEEPTLVDEPTEETADPFEEITQVNREPLGLEELVTLLSYAAINTPWGAFSAIFFFSAPAY